GAVEVHIRGVNDDRRRRTMAPRQRFRQPHQAPGQDEGMPPAPKRERRLRAGLLLPVLALGCGDAIAEVAATRGVGGATTTSVTATGGAGGAPPSATHCNNKIYQCGDLQHNDGDGLVD